MKVLYEARASATGGRNGHVKTSDGSLDLQLAMPTELGGLGGTLANPEQLFAAGYAACFDSALAFVGAEQKINLSGTRVDVTVGIGQRKAGGFGLTVRLEVAIPNVSREQAQNLLEAAHAVCPYSNAVHGNVEVDLSVI